MAVRVQGTATVPASLQTNITTILNNVATILGRVTGAVALAADLVTAQADITTLLARLTASRAGYLDNLSAGAVALASVTALQATTSESGTDAQSVDNTIRQLVASTAAAVRKITFQGTAYGVGAANISIYILTGAGGSEVTRAIGGVHLESLLQESFQVTVQINLASGTRVAWKVVNSTANNTSAFIGYVIEEA